MQDLINVLNSLEINYPVVYLRGKEDNQSDVDYFLRDIKEVENIDLFLTKSEFFKKDHSSSKLNYVRFTPEFEMIDFELNYSYIFEYWYKLKLRDYFLCSYLKDPRKHLLQFNTIRYLFTFKSDEKSISFFQKNKAQIQENKFFLYLLNINPFQKDLSYDCLDKILNRNLWCLFRYLKFKFFLFYCFKRRFGLCLTHRNTVL